MNEETQEIIYLTHAAAKHIRECMMPGYHIRVGVQGGGCSGFSYVCEAQEIELRGEHDTVIPYDTFELVIGQKDMIYLKGMEIDYDAGFGGKGFVFSNPLATSTCGCGESFSVT